jgi:hypothetical protein
MSRPYTKEVNQMQKPVKEEIEGMGSVAATAPVPFVAEAEIVEEVLKAGMQGVSVLEGMAPEEQEILLEYQTRIERGLLKMEKGEILLKVGAFEVGEVLSLAKKRLGHGKYQPWIVESFGKGLSLSKAAHCKQIYEKLADHKDKLKYLPFGYLLQLSQDTYPDTLLEIHLAASEEALAELDTRALTKANKDFKSGVIGQEQYEKLTEEAVDFAESYLCGEAQLRHSERGKRMVKLGLQSCQVQVQLLTDHLEKSLSKNVKKYLELNPPAAEGHGSPKLEDISEEAIIADIHHLKGVLDQFEYFIRNPSGLMKQRLTDTGGVIQKGWVPKK